MSFQRKTVQCLSPLGLHNMSYKEWGDPNNSKVLICVHGITRVSDDFDGVAQALMQEYRVICPDVVGRGQSDWLANPQLYQIPQYVSDMVTLLARVNAETVHWLGTSMGGLIGIGMAAMKNSPIAKLILNDVGPTLDFDALLRIGEYLGKDMRFNQFDDAVNYIREISASFGPHTDAQWHKMAGDVLKQNSQGEWVRHYDLSLAIPVRAATKETVEIGQKMLWLAYDAITCPTLLVRGSQSDLLSVDTAKQMQERGPHATLVEIEGVGHAPMFVHPQQIDIVKNFLLT
ncbi:MAG: alpha/beta hydrolase [Undibacterium sp.]|nr:alpha/beta hydrolase [Undibacterium sp.]